MKSCSKCKELKPLTEYWRHPGCKSGLTPSCKSCHRLAAASWRNKNPEKQKEKTEKKRISSLTEPYRVKQDRRLRHQYGISVDQWDNLLKKQSGCCAICGKHQSDLSRVLQVDHSHRTGEIRGLLCTKCNTKLAVVEEREFTIKAEIYLNRQSIKIVGD